MQEAPPTAPGEAPPPIPSPLRWSGEQASWLPLSRARERGRVVRGVLGRGEGLVKQKEEKRRGTNDPASTQAGRPVRHLGGSSARLRRVLGGDHGRGKRDPPQPEPGAYPDALHRRGGRLRDRVRQPGRP